jgi:hypothetical protein
MFSAVHMMFRVLFVAALLLIPAVVRAKPAVDDAAFAPKLTIYLAKGAANACGPGCDRWIAVEGRIDQDAASRISRFLRNVKDTHRPLYFHSPGGSVEQSFVIGRLLRRRKAVARVGRTIVAACGAGTQVDDACLKIKAGGGEVEAEIATRHAMCNSACSYLFLGATTREVSPDAAMAVHNSKLTLVLRGHPSPQQIAAFTDRTLAKADRERASFIEAMGISHELTDLVRTVKFENMHILTRPELYRFGIDTRSTVETAWTLEGAARPFVRTIILARKDDGQSFRTMELRLFCENKDRARLTFVREFDKGAAGMNSVIMIAASEKPVIFGKFPARARTYEVWSETVAPGTMKALLTASHMQMGEGASIPDGQPSLVTFDVDTNGLDAAWTQILASCPAAPVTGKSVIASPALTSDPGQ